MKTIGKKSALLAALEGVNTGLSPDEFTVQDFVNEAEQEGKLINRRTAAEYLNRLAASGKLKMRKVTVTGNIFNAYSQP